LRGKVSYGYSPSSKDLAPNILDFKPILDSPLKKIVRAPPSLVGGALARFGHSLACVKKLGAQHPLGAKIWFPEKVDLSSYNYTSRSPKFLDKSSLNFFCCTPPGGITVDHTLGQF